MKSFVAAGSAALALALAPAAWPHAEITPSVVEAGEGQLFTLVVPTEKEDADTIRVDLTYPDGFEIDSFVPSRDWQRIAGGRSVTWNGGRVPHEEAATFQFVGSAQDAKDYTFGVRQLYSDGSVVNWSGPEDSDTPAPVLQVESSLADGDGTPLVAWIALGVAGLAVVLAAGAIAARGGARELA